MFRTRAKRTAAIPISLAAAVIFGLTLYRSVLYAPADDAGLAVPAPSAQAPLASLLAYPSRLIIPALNIDANVQYVGITPKGNMGTPTNFTDVAWYKLGAIPGQVGSAVMDGHVDNGLSLAGVFKHLSGMKPGQDIFVENASGTLEHFVTVSVDSYPYLDAPTDLIFNQRDAAYLKLITCTGDWVQGDRTYDRRFVVTAILR